MKIKNRHSRKRFSPKENFGIYIMNYLRKVARRHPNSSLYKNLNKNYTLKKYDLSNIEIDLSTITIYEILLAEDLVLKKDRSSFINLFQKNGIKKIIPSNDIERISGWFNTTRTTINNFSWTNLGIINFEKNILLSNYIDYIHIYGITLSSSLSILEIQLIVKEELTQDINTILKNTVDKINILYLPRLKSFIHNIKSNFKHMFGVRYDETITKQILIQDIITEIKTEALNEISRFVNLYFTSHKTLAPSLNTFLTNIKHSDKSNQANKVLRPLGIHYTEGHLSKNGAFALFFDKHYGKFNKDFFACSLLINKKVANSYTLGVQSFVHGTIRDLPWIMCTTTFNILLNYIEKDFSIYKNKLNSSIQKKNLVALLGNKNTLKEKMILVSKISEILKRRSLEHGVKIENKHFTELKFHGYKQQNLNNKYDFIKYRTKLLTQNENELHKNLNTHIDIKRTRKTISQTILSFVTTLLTLTSVIIAILSVIIAIISFISAKNLNDANSNFTFSYIIEVLKGFFTK